MKYNITLLFFFSLFISLNAQNYRISGYVTDNQNDLGLIGASVEAKTDGIGIFTDENGYYTLNVSTYDQELLVSYIGYKDVVIDLSKYSNQQNIDIQMSEEDSELDEIVINGSIDRNVKEVQMSVNKLDIAVIQKLPSFLGEKDLIKSIQLLPGVTTVGEGASGFNVRGGSIDQNLILMDEAPIYNSSHLFGFFSVFNPDAVKNAELYKGGIPARFGGRLSSILNVGLKDGSDTDLEVNGGIGTIFSRLSIEAPVIKNKSSIIVAGRRSYIDVLAKPFLKGDFKNSVLNFYDLTLKSNNSIDEKNNLYISAYLGRDNFAFGDNAGFNWGNKTTSIKWNHIFNDKWSSNITGYFSDYEYDINFGDTAEDTFDWDASIRNLSLKGDVSYFFNSFNILRLGAQSIYYTFEPANAISVSNNVKNDFSVAKQYALESALYLENEIALLESLKVNYGLRFSYFAYLGGRKKYEYGDTVKSGVGKALVSEEMIDNKWDVIKPYYNFEPRIGINYLLDDTKSIKLSYNRTSQYIHLLSNTTASTPVDVWTPSTNNIKPQLADQFAIGYFQNLDNNTYELSAELYYKDMNQLVDYIDGATLLLNEYVESQVLEGKGRAYGLELLAKKNRGKLTGWFSYTLARSERKVIGVSNDEWYPSRFDKTHNLNISAIYDLNPRWSFSSTFTYATGTPTTLPNARYNQGGYYVPYNSGNGRNNFRVPDYHRLDFSVTLHPKRSNRRWKGTWVFGVYNVYSRRNPFSIYGDIQQERPTGQPIKTTFKQLSVVGNFVPSISYNFKFK